VRCRATFDPARDLYGAVTQSFRRPVRTEPAATAVLLDETHHLLSVHGRQELRDMRQHQIAAETMVLPTPARAYINAAFFNESYGVTL
jgi:hypothetical protein